MYETVRKREKEGREKRGVMRVAESEERKIG